MAENLRKGRWRGWHVFGLWLFAVLVVAGYLMPLLYVVIGGFFRQEGLPTSIAFGGWANYAVVAGSASFWRAVRASLAFASISALGQVVVGVLAAVVLWPTFRLSRVARAVTLLPYFAPTVVLVMAWHFLTDPTAGVLPLLGIVIDFRSQRYALYGMVAVSVYEAFPFVSLLVLSRLLQIDTRLMGQARIDGAGFVKTFSDICWPSIRGLVGGLFVLRVVLNALKFDVPWLTYAFRGRNDVSDTLAVWIYRTAFLDLHFGVALAGAVIGLCVLSVGLAPLLLARRVR